MFLIDYFQTYQQDTNSLNSVLNSLSIGRDGGSCPITFASTSKSVLQSRYGKAPVANSTNVIPRDQTSARTS